MFSVGAVLLFSVPVIAAWAGILWWMSRAVAPRSPMEELAVFVGATHLPNSPVRNGWVDPEQEESSLLQRAA